MAALRSLSSHPGQCACACLPLRPCHLVPSLSWHSRLWQGSQHQTNLLRLSPACSYLLARSYSSPVLAPASVQDYEIAPVLTERTCGLALGDRHDWRPVSSKSPSERRGCAGPLSLSQFAQVQSDRELCLGLGALSHRQRVWELTDRCTLKRVWARDLWHLRNRLLRMILMHTLGLWFNQQNAAPLLQLE